MSLLDDWIACAGSWRGVSTLQDPELGIGEESPSTVKVTPVLVGRFVRLDYTWSYRGQPQEGSLLIGFEKGEETITAHWIDTWHMSDKVMACRGPRPDGPTLALLGSYPAPPGADWGWRIELTVEPEGTLRLVMYNLWPEGGREDLAVEATYTRT